MHESNDYEAKQRLFETMSLPYIGTNVLLIEPGGVIIGHDSDFNRESFPHLDADYSTTVESHFPELGFTMLSDSAGAFGQLPNEIATTLYEHVTGDYVMICGPVVITGSPNMSNVGLAYEPYSNAALVAVLRAAVSVYGVPSSNLN